MTHVRFPDTRQGFEWFLKSRFDVAVFVSNALREDAVREAPVLFEGRDEVIHDSVQPATLSTAEERRAVRMALGLPLDGTVVGIAGQVAEIKGIWEFIEAAAQLTSRGAQLTFVVIGDDLKGNGRLRIEAERAAAARGLGERMRFTGFRPDARRIIAALDVVVVPSHVEPLGLSVLEAMSAGVPVIGSRVGGIPEIIVDRQTGLLVPPRDAAALADAISWMVADEARARAFGSAGRDRARTVFSVEAQALRVQSVYDRLLTRSPRASVTARDAVGTAS
jgi:glycosyltransferase involved in cell wall biosynthesis